METSCCHSLSAPFFLCHFKVMWIQTRELELWLPASLWFSDYTVGWKHPCLVFPPSLPIFQSWGYWWEEVYVNRHSSCVPICILFLCTFSRFLLLHAACGLEWTEVACILQNATWLHPVSELLFSILFSHPGFIANLDNLNFASSNLEF